MTDIFLMAIAASLIAFNFFRAIGIIIYAYLAYTLIPSESGLALATFILIAGEKWLALDLRRRRTFE